MNESDLKFQAQRIAKYRELEAKRDELCAALKQITEDWKEFGPCGQGPFTGNTRESRLVKSLHIAFSETRGGAPAVDMKIPTLNIEASFFGRMLQDELRPKIDALNAEMEKL